MYGRILLKSYTSNPGISPVTQLQPYLSRSGRDRQVETCQLPALQAEKVVAAGGLHAATSSAVPQMRFNLGMLLIQDLVTVCRDGWVATHLYIYIYIPSSHMY